MAHARAMKLPFVARASRRAASTVVSTFFSAVTAIRLEIQREVNALPPIFHRAVESDSSFPPKSNLNLPPCQSLTHFNRLSPKILPLNFNQEARGIPVDTWFAARKVLEALSEVV
jgi:hypothetical protein